MAGTDLLGFIWSGSSDGFFSIEDPNVGSLEFDSIDAEVHDWQRDVTQNPVENGSPVADHIIDRPRNLTITGMISNSPIDGSNIFLGGNLLDTDRVAEAFQVLDALYKSKSLITIYTRYANYVDMAISDLNIPRSPDLGNAITISIQATQFRIVTTQSTNTPPGLGVKKQSDSTGKAGTSNSADKPTQKRASPVQNNGKSTSDVGLLEGIASGAGSAIEKLKQKAADIISGSNL